MAKEDIQGAFFQMIKDNLPGHLALVDEIADRILVYIELKHKQRYQEMDVSPIEGRPLTYGDLFEEDSNWGYRINFDEIEDSKFPNAYLMDRTDILKFIMKELSGVIKS